MTTQAKSQNTDYAEGILRCASEAALVAILSTLFFCWISVRSEYVGNLSDAAVYLSQSDYFSPFRPAPYDIGAAMFYEYSFPPLFPLVLALLGGGSEHPQLSYIATSIMMGAALGTVYLWMRSLPLAISAALTMTLAFGLLPASLLTAMGMQSEPLYVAMIFAGLACWNLRASIPRTAPLGAGLIGLSSLVRMVGVSAIAALLIAWFLDPGRRYKILIPLLALAPITAWLLLRMAAGMNESYVDFVRQDSVGATLSFVANQIARNPAAMWSGLVRGFDLLGLQHATAAVVLFTGVFCVGWGVRLRRCELDALYLLFYLGIILLWPFPNHMRRFLQIVLPIYLVYIYLGSITLASSFDSRFVRRTVSGAVLIAIIIVMAPSTGIMIGQVIAAKGTAAEDYVRAPQWYEYDTPTNAAKVMGRVRRVLDAMRGIDELLPPAICVSSAIYAYIPMYGHRRAVPLPGILVGDQAFFEALKECPYVFMMSGSVWPPSAFPSMYPHERIKERFDVIEVSLFDGTATRGAVLTMLGKVRFPHDDSER